MITPYKTRVHRLTKRLCDDIAAYLRGSDIPCSWRLQVYAQKDGQSLVAMLVTFITREDGHLHRLQYAVGRKVYTRSKVKPAWAEHIGESLVIAVKEYLNKKENRK